ncbi:hypothetical protein FJZ31_32815 [Candidatus Poribacteria bacterium]|nr:hypothetical protein [Candidatus Poribacteria bacterium]
MAKPFEDMTPEEFLAAIEGYINREDEEIPADQFFQLVAQEVKQPILETIEVPVRAVDGEIHLEPVENLVVVENNILILGGKRLIFKLVS